MGNWTWHRIPENESRSELTDVSSVSTAVAWEKEQEKNYLLLFLQIRWRKTRMKCLLLCDAILFCWQRLEMLSLHHCHMCFYGKVWATHTFRLLSLSLYPWMKWNWRKYKWIIVQKRSWILNKSSSIVCLRDVNTMNLDHENGGVSMVLTLQLNCQLHCKYLFIYLLIRRKRTYVF